MKFKAVTNENAPRQFIEALNRLRDTLEHEIVHKCFHMQVGQMGPGELYVQMTDFAAHQWPFINYNASAITIKEGRNFGKALDELERILCDLVINHWRDVGEIQIMIVIAASTEDGNKSKLYETAIMFDSNRVR